MTNLLRQKVVKVLVMILYGHRVTLWGKVKTEGRWHSPWDLAASSHLTVFQGKNSRNRENGQHNRTVGGVDHLSYRKGTLEGRGP
jgi:hypothetical protein